MEQVLLEFNNTVLIEIEKYCKKLTTEFFTQAVDLIQAALKSGHRLHITGIGKPHHIACYMASLFSSIGTPCYFLNGTEAIHGSSGQVLPGDVVICISYYGNVPELIPTMRTLRNNEASLISVTGFDESVIAREADVHLNCHVEKEGDPLGKPPRTSMLVTLYTLMALSLLLQQINGMDDESYVRFHPAGQLGQKRINADNLN